MEAGWSPFFPRMRSEKAFATSRPPVSLSHSGWVNVEVMFLIVTGKLHGTLSTILYAAIRPTLILLRRIGTRTFHTPTFTPGSSASINPSAFFPSKPHHKHNPKCDIIRTIFGCAESGKAWS
jgi:hypothetical protein